MKEQLLRAKQGLEADAAIGAGTAAADADAGGATDAARAGGGGATASKAQKRAKKADDYHARHRDWVAQFNELTGGECADGASGVKWAAVRAWQQKHWQLNNLLADGLVGPKTLEAAKLLAQKSAPKDDKAAAGAGSGDGKAKDASPPVGGKANEASVPVDGGANEANAAQPGHADGAEAAADKPNLEADVDEQLAPEARSGAPKPTGAAQQQATLADFETAVAKLAKLIDHYHPPKAAEGEKPIAQHYVEGTDDAEAPPAIGAMMSKEVLVGYEAAAKQLASQWDSLGQPHARAQFLLNAVNEALAAEQVPAILRMQLEKLPNPGEFEAAHWIMKMNETIFGASKLKNKEKEVDAIASQVFHEGRHAEQRFAVARLIAARQPTASAKEIKKAANVPPEIAQKAIELRGEKMSPEQEKAAGAFKHATVDNKAHQDIETQSAAITDAANAAADVFRALGPADQQAVAARWQEVRQRTTASLEAYYHLATERDAYAAQKQLAAANK